MMHGSQDYCEIPLLHPLIHDLLSSFAIVDGRVAVVALLFHTS